MKGLGGVGRMLVLGCIASFALPALADFDPNACRGVDFDVKRPLVVSRISVRPRVNFVKGADDDAACPADSNACRKKTYLVPGDLVLTGRAQGTFTCVSYQSFHWVPTSSLTPLQPTDWVGTWSHPGGTISIRRGSGGMLSIEGEHTYPAAQNVHTGVVGATIVPTQGMIAFAEDGSVPFEQAEEGQCLVRMQRVGEWLLVEDNMQCGGSMVTFTGLYRRD